MTPRSVILYICAVGVVLAAIIGGAAIWTQGGNQPSSASTSSPPSSSAPSPATPSPTEFHDDENEPTLCETDHAALRQRSVEFAIAWNQLEPKDTATSRQLRLKPYVASGFFDRPDNSVEVDTTSMAGRARIEQGIRQLAGPTDTEPEVVCAADHDEANTRVSVEVWTEDQLGAQINPPMPLALSINWVYSQSTWQATLVRTI